MKTSRNNVIIGTLSLFVLLLVATFVYLNKDGAEDADSQLALNTTKGNYDAVCLNESQYSGGPGQCIIDNNQCTIDGNRKICNGTQTNNAVNQLWTAESEQQCGNEAGIQKQTRNFQVEDKCTMEFELENNNSDTTKATENDMDESVKKRLDDQMFIVNGKNLSDDTGTSNGTGESVSTGISTGSGAIVEELKIVPYKGVEIVNLTNKIYDEEFNKDLSGKFKNQIAKRFNEFSKSRTGSGDVVDRIRYVKGEDVTLSSFPNDYDLLIVEDGNITIDNNIIHNQGDEEGKPLEVKDAKKLGIMVINDSYDLRKMDEQKGNIFVTPNVTRIDGFVYSDGAFLSANSSGTVFASDDQDRYAVLDKQLTVNGGLFTRNNIGGYDEEGNKGTLPGLTDQELTGSGENDTKLLFNYDLNYLRRGVTGCELNSGATDLLVDSGATATGVTASGAAFTISSGATDTGSTEPAKTNCQIEKPLIVNYEVDKYLPVGFDIDLFK